MRSAVVGVVLLGVVAACGQSETSEEPRTAPTTQPGLSTVAETEQDPAKAMKAALRTLMKDSTGSYSSKVDYGAGGQAVIEEGVYDLRSQRSRYLMSIVNLPEGDDLAFEYIKDRKQVWFRYEKTGFVEGSTCWMHMPADRLKDLHGIAPASRGTYGLPAAVNVALQGKGQTWDQPGEVLRGTTDLYTLASAVGKMTTEFGLDFESTDRVEVDFVLEDGRLVGWKASLPTLVEAAKHAGGKVPDELLGVELEGDFPITADFTDLGEPVSIERPDRRKVLDFDPNGTTEEEYEAEFQACEAR